MKPFTTYTCTIHAVAGSAGPKSDPIIVTTDQQGWNLSSTNNLTLSNVSASNPPVILSLTTIDSQSVRVTWRTPTQPNGVLISYTITYTAGGKTITTTVPYGGNVNEHSMCCNISIGTYRIT